MWNKLNWTGLDYLVDIRLIRHVRDSIATEHILSFSFQKGWSIFCYIYESAEFKRKLLQIYRLLIWNGYCKLQMIRYIVNVLHRCFATFFHNHWIDAFSLTVSAHTGDKMFSVNSTGNQLQQSQRVKQKALGTLHFLLFLCLIKILRAEHPWHRLGPWHHIAGSVSVSQPPVWLWEKVR